LVGRSIGQQLVFFSFGRHSFHEQSAAHQETQRPRVNSEEKRERYIQAANHEALDVFSCSTKYFHTCTILLFRHIICRHTHLVPLQLFFPSDTQTPFGFHNKVTQQLAIRTIRKQSIIIFRCQLTKFGELIPRNGGKILCIKEINKKHIVFPSTTDLRDVHCGNQC